MILSRILMVLALGVLAYLVYITMNSSENFKNDIQVKKAVDNAAPKVEKMELPKLPKLPKPVLVPKAENFSNEVAQPVVNQPVVNQPIVNQENFVAEPQQIVYDKPNVENKISYEPVAKVETFNNKDIKYEKFINVDGIADSVHGAAPFGAKPALDESDMATVKFTGMVDGTPGDVIQIEGTDLLTAPLVDNMLYTNSIANTNRNASQDLRGDIPLQFNESYTPFYSSVIYGAPLSQKQMTIGTI